MTDFLIIGAGINGLLTARQLALAGASVLVVDKGYCFAEASWAGGGIVSPLYPWRYPAAITALATWAQNLYPQMVDELFATTGVDSELTQCGLLMLQPDDEKLALDWAYNCDRSMRQVKEEFIYHHEPHLAVGFQNGLWMPEVANVRNPRLGQALLADLGQRGNVAVMENRKLIEFITKSRRVIGIVCAGTAGRDEMQADKVIICAGAWSGILSEQLQFSLPVQPVKGQMLLYQSTIQLSQSIVLYRGKYIIPRRDGHFLVGSTLEYCGFDKSPSQNALDSLKAAAIQMIPAVGDLKPVAQWAGLRPGAPDGIPYIGAVPQYDNLYLNTGQYRNGLVLAPASARLLADILLKRQPVVDPSPYDPARSVL